MIAYKGFERDLTCRGFQYMDGHKAEKAKNNPDQKG